MAAHITAASTTATLTAANETGSASATSQTAAHGANPRVEMIALTGIPEIVPGDCLDSIILARLAAAGLALEDGDVLVVAQKIVSKSEGRYASLRRVAVSPEADMLALEIDKDPRLAQLVLDESVAVLRKRPGVVIVEHRNGYVHANAGIDHSNIPFDAEDPKLLLLPVNPDASAAKLRDALHRETGATVAVIINDSAGRAWRNGVIGFAIGTAGIEPVTDLIGSRDRNGNILQVTQIAVADEMAAAASMLMGQGAESLPVILVRGARYNRAECGSKALIRPREIDLFR